MTTITAAQIAGRPSVHLTIDHDQPVTEIYRADVNGTTPVRLYPDTLPTSASGSLVVVDHEPALVGPVVYRVGAATARLELDYTDPVFTIPGWPVTEVAVPTVTTYKWSRIAAGTVHDIINRPDPVARLAPMRPRSGQLEAVTQSHTRAADLEALFAAGQVIMYRQPDIPGHDLYLLPQTVDLDTTEDASAFVISVTYQGMARPAMPFVSDANWTFDTLAATGGSFNEVSGRYRSFKDLRAGDDR